MMTHYDDFWLYPAALGVLVLSKSHNVLRAAVVPRVLPPAMSLTSANARLSVFGLATAGVAGALGGRARGRARLRLGARARPPPSSSSPACSRCGSPATSTSPPASSRPTC